MKKQLLSPLVLSSAAIIIASALTSCGGSGSVDDSLSGVLEKETISIQFVPSRSASDLAVQADALEPILEKYAPDYKFEITTGTTYAAVTEAMLSDQVDIGFLTASGYAQVAIEEPGKVDVLLTSVRAGYKVQADDYKGTDDASRAKQVQAMNGEIDGYVYRGEQAQTKVNFYNSICVCLKDDARTALGLSALDADKDGKVSIHELAGKTVARQGETSGAGYLYPSKYLYDNGMSMVDDSPDASKGQIKGVVTSGYDTALANLMSGAVDAAWFFMDVRYTNGYSKSGSEYYQKDSIFTSTYTVAMTDGIYNDTISARANLSTAKKEAVKAAFKAAISDKDGSEILYKVYSHTGYTDAKDSDFAGEKEMYQWKIDHLA